MLHTDCVLTSMCILVDVKIYVVAIYEMYFVLLIWSQQVWHCNIIS